MKIRGAIFDTDGTLIESMYIWETAASDFVKSLGRTPKPDLDYRACRLSTPDTVKILREEYGIEGSDEELARGLEAIVAERYKNEVPIKDGYVRAFLEELAGKGIPMCVATGTAKPLIESALIRLDLRKYFADVISTVDTGINKHQPNVYYKAAALLGADDPAEVAVFEDAKYAAKTAKDAGFYVTAIYSDFFKADWEELRSFADGSIRSYSEILGKFS